MLHTLLIALAVVGSIAAIVALCIIVTKRQTQHKNQQLKDSYRALLSQHNIQPDFSQTFEHRVFAIDNSGKTFAFVQNDEAQPSGIIDLADVAECKLWKDGVQLVRKGQGRKETTEEYISAVGLSFKHRSGATVNVPVYTEVLDGIEEKATLTKAAEGWIEHINASLSGISNTRLAATA